MVPFSEFVRNYRTKSDVRRVALARMKADMESGAFPKRCHVRTLRAYIHELPERDRVGAMGLFHIWREHEAWAEKTQRMRRNARLA